MQPRQLALSDAALPASQRRSRIQNLERKVAAVRPTRNKEKALRANEIFKDF